MYFICILWFLYLLTKFGKDWMDLLLTNITTYLSHFYISPSRRLFFLPAVTVIQMLFSTL